MFSIFNISVFALVFSVLAANFSLADQTLNARDCTTEDVSAPLGELRYQGNIGWCYANVAADMLTFRYQKELFGQKASAGYVALIFNQHLKLKANADAGYMTPAILLSQVNGICPQFVEDTYLSNSPYKTIREQINALVDLKSDYDMWKRSGKGPFDSVILQAYKNSKSAIGQLAEEELISILEHSSPRNFPRRLAERFCYANVVKVKFDAKIRVQMSAVEWMKNIIPSLFVRDDFTPLKNVGKADIIKHLHEEISKKNMVGIGYNTRIFYDQSLPNARKGGPHASSIVGRKWNDRKQVCEFKLRNSWGKDCSQYTNPDLKHSCDEKSGYIYIPDTLLQKTITDIVYFTP